MCLNEIKVNNEGNNIAEALNLTLERCREIGEEVHHIVRTSKDMKNIVKRSLKFEKEELLIAFYCLGTMDAK